MTIPLILTAALAIPHVTPPRTTPPRLTAALEASAARAALFAGIGALVGASVDKLLVTNKRVQVSFRF